MKKCLYLISDPLLLSKHQNSNFTLYIQPYKRDKMPPLPNFMLKRLCLTLPYKINKVLSIPQNIADKLLTDNLVFIRYFIRFNFS